MYRWKMFSDKQKLIIVVLLVATLGEIFALSGIFLIHFNKPFFNENIDIIETYIKASTAFFGSFFSFLTALLMFLFQKNRDKKKELVELGLIFDKLKSEYEKNFLILSELTEVIKCDPDKMAEYIKSGGKQREQFIITIYKLRFTMFNSYFGSFDWRTLKEVDSKVDSYVEMFEESNQIKILLDLILKKEVAEIENITQLLRLAINKVELLREKEAGLNK